MDFAWFCLHFLAFKPCTGFELACPSSQAPDFGLLGPPVNAAQGANGAKHSPANRAPAFGFACPRCQAPGFGWPGPPGHAFWGGQMDLRFAKNNGFAMVLLTFRRNCAPAQKPGGAIFAKKNLVGADSSFSKFLDKKLSPSAAAFGCGRFCFRRCLYEATSEYTGV